MGSVFWGSPPTCAAPYTHLKAILIPTKEPVAWFHHRIAGPCLGLEPVDLPEIVLDREVFQEILYGLEWKI